MSYVCISCDNKEDKLYHDYKGGIIKIAICSRCGRVVDKYIEYDLMIVSLDALLLKRQAFRHILINSGIKSHWKFCLVLLICEAITKLLRQSYTDQTRPWLSDNVLYTALEVDLYWNFLAASIELFSLLTGVLVWMVLWRHFSRHKHSWPSGHEFVSGLMLSTFGNVFVLPAILWGQKYSVVYTWLCSMFTIAANVQAARVLCPVWNLTGLVSAVLFGHLMTTGAEVTLQYLYKDVT